MPMRRMEWYGIAKAVLGLAAVLSIPCSLHASAILLRTDISNGSQTHRSLPGSTALLAASVTARSTAANGRLALQKSFGDDPVLGYFAATPETLGTGPSLQVSLEAVRSEKPESDERTVGAVLYKSADNRLVLRPHASNAARYETVDGIVRPPKQEEILGGGKGMRREIRLADGYARFASDDDASENMPEPSTFALLGFGLLLVWKRGARRRCI